MSEVHRQGLLFFLLLIASLMQFSLSQEVGDHEYQTCAPSPFSCGDTRLDVVFPFRVKGRPNFCGHPDLLLVCYNNSYPVLENSENQLMFTNKVEAINYTSQILTLNETTNGVGVYQDSFIYLFSVFLNGTPSDFFSVFFNGTNTTGYVISNGTLNNYVIDNTTQIPTWIAKSFWNINFYNYVIDNTTQIPTLESSLFEFSHPCAYAQISCGTDYESALISHMELDGLVLNLTQRTTSYELLDKAWRRSWEFMRKARGRGLELRWSVGRGWCSYCVRSGGRCGFNPKNIYEPFCFCPNRSCPSMFTAPGVDEGTIIMKLIIGISVAAGIFLVACLPLCLCLRGRHMKFYNSIYFWRKKTLNTIQNVEDFLENYGSLAPKRYNYSDVKKITKSFADKLGEGGYGAVFKGKLPDGRPVAVKVLNDSNGDGVEFINEVASIGSTYHVNIVGLLGFCSDGSKRALIYEFMPNGSLEKFIYAEKTRMETLGLENLYKIAIGIARGLEYLHHGCNMRILHFDIKPHNILLDGDYCPKISDFGLAKLCPGKESIVSLLGARGTVGYTAPEVFCQHFGGVSSKSDVYSYGMMILEMAGGRKNIDVGVDKTSEIFFPHWIYKHLDLGKDLSECGVATEAEEETAKKMILVGLWCIQTQPGDRPSMSQVLEMLEGSIEDLQMPSNPFLSSP